MHKLSVFAIIFLLSYTARASGQCTTSVCKDCNSGSEEIVLRRLEELDERIQMMYKRMNVPTGLQDLQDSVSASEQRILRRLQELQQNPMNDKPNSTSAHQILQDHCRGNPVVCDCSSIKDNGYTTSGVYLLYVVHQGKRYYAFAYCDMTTADSGWTVFQRRKDGTVDFYRGWNDYENGFGNPNGEFWLGNEFLHLLTSKKSYRLRVDLKDFEGGERFAEFFPFSISSSEDKYRLTVGLYRGNAGDSFRRHNNRNFTTKDADNDPLASGNCAVNRRGAWWYDQCNDSNLNGLYYHGNYTSTCSGCGYEGIWWYGWRGSLYSLKTTEMKIFSPAS